MTVMQRRHLVRNYMMFPASATITAYPCDAICAVTIVGIHKIVRHVEEALITERIAPRVSRDKNLENVRIAHDAHAMTAYDFLARLRHWHHASVFVTSFLESGIEIETKYEWPT